MTAQPSGKTTAQPNSPDPGRMTTSAPAKASPTSTQRAGRTRSFSSQAASNVTSTGVSIWIAVNSGTGMYCTPQKLKTLVASSSAPRSIWKRGCAGRRARWSRQPSHAAITTACVA